MGIAGASGFIGQHLVTAFSADGARSSTIGRSGSGTDARWGDRAAITDLLEAGYGFECAELEPALLNVIDS